MEHQGTARRGLEQGVRYEPLVFTTQGGIQRNAEAILSELASSVARVECRGAAEVKVELLQDVSLSLARSVASAVRRRCPRSAATRGNAARRLIEEAECLEEALQDQ